MGFPMRFCSWVLGYICNPWFSVLVNRQLSKAITAGCGFRQRCPLSPYLFILGLELLSLQFHQRFCVTIPNVRKCLSILEEYCSWMGQKIIKNKYAILFSRSTTSSTKHRLARLAVCRKVEEMDYLGIRFTLRRPKMADFSHLHQKIHALTLAWGVRHLSFAGWINMVN
ncbi:uncharacterized protein LOC110108237 [Dendrobium catenatum]|uniref:uncharacterized protein LOC110108237 n=1 Tax=Dendrobium catenatum TaxID=906689 RepID=UPI0009F6569F|nr:uncharacterized protein LOC110108237 [Dendrobium catenatum]